ncbi:MAG: hypothetical protein BGO82_18055 [Devosia sp. 67-54]|uniref:hypothetical protein n=1 Tax=unclassified Devosia TaxID=196773 RepID=UPI00095EB5BC|nr:MULTISPECIES: hypothetical protein [unclassified Devosia]MBN9304279.1 hypothetical protein [Devosia sp.]OJX18094.1 MAG: hypothetical protein BGO82_18055 [Devosia sp. 67-54]
MANEADDAVIQILRQIQDKLVEHDRRFDRMQHQMDHRFDGVDRKLGEVIDATTKALGTAAIANVRHDSVQTQLAEVELEVRDLRARVRELEEKV